MSNPANIARQLQNQAPTQRCDLTDLFPDQCGCAKHRNVMPEQQVKVKRATWRGVCRCCLVNVIEPGMAIEPYEDGWKLVDCDA